MQIEQKLVAVEAKLRRWHTRLLRAANEVSKLEKQRRRYHALLTGNPKKVRN